MTLLLTWKRARVSRLARRRLLCAELFFSLLRAVLRAVLAPTQRSAAAPKRYPTERTCKQGTCSSARGAPVACRARERVCCCIQSAAPEAPVRHGRFAHDRCRASCPPMPAADCTGSRKRPRGPAASCGACACARQRRLRRGTARRAPCGRAGAPSGVATHLCRRRACARWLCRYRRGSASTKSYRARQDLRLPRSAASCRKARRPPPGALLGHQCRCASQGQQPSAVRRQASSRLRANPI